MNPIKRELCGLAVLAIGIPGTLFMTLVMPKPNIGHALAFERCNRNHIKLEAERWGRGEKQNKEEDRKKAWSH
ncbi:MAG TPA: hypothetical protein VN132_09610, partial [Bdellovibrio sp.]|nr:hypothetical protein [Bdellovibrio sp.]